MRAPGRAKSAKVRRNRMAEYEGVSTYCMADMSSALDFPPPAAPPNKASIA